MADFTQTSINKSSTRILTAPLSTIANLKTVVDAFAADTSMNIPHKAVKKISLKVPIIYYDADGEEKGTVVMDTTNIDDYNDAVRNLEDNVTLIQKITGSEVGGEGAADTSKANWTYTFDCKKGDDTFQVVFHKNKMLVTNYSADETLYAIETWADTQSLLE